MEHSDHTLTEQNVNGISSRSSADELCLQLTETLGWAKISLGLACVQEHAVFWVTVVPSSSYEIRTSCVYSDITSHNEY